ncbi:MAG: gamma-glutamyl-gamma-aminobutyrate hydrolase family protein [Firmicutes bacterium]|nr:gamma-glutamyl-gamma-aminobutyrate hydrolase family protein [Alicyclobacillaceae bacterium]MCL6497471.1 gamma-glutamyl-gamma-aminobutyrate hydrolase family protein [Bacillota bacterium]
MGAQAPVIAICAQRVWDREGTARDAVRLAYSAAVVRAGGIPVLLPCLPEAKAALAACHGVVLTGGGDVDPRGQGWEDQGTDWTGVVPERDGAELAVIAEARRRRLPVLGICRGMQVLAVAAGAELIQDLRQAGFATIDHAPDTWRGHFAHRVVVEPGTKLSALVPSRVLPVNSFHHQAVRAAPEGWRVAARSDDGVIEAIEWTGPEWWVGVQWHPEDLVDREPAALALFRGLVAAAGSEGPREP